MSLELSCGLLRAPNEMFLSWIKTNPMSSGISSPIHKNPNTRIGNNEKGKPTDVKIIPSQEISILLHIASTP